MSKFDDIKQKILEKAGALADKSVVAAKSAADGAKTLARKAKLNAEIAAERESLRKNFAELGKEYYAKCPTPEDETLAEIAGRIAASFEAISAKQAEIDALGEENEEEVEIVEEVQEAAETAAQAVEEAAENAAETVEEVVEEIKDKIEE